MLALTKRQREVYDLVKSRRTDREIADSCGITTYTVRAHIVMVAAKIGGQGAPRTIIRQCRWPEEAT